MDSDVQVVPGVPTLCGERGGAIHHGGIKKAAPTKNGAGLRRVSSVTGGLAGYGVVMGNPAAMVNMTGVVPQLAPAGPYNVVGVPFGYSAIPPYGYGCVGVAPTVEREVRKSVVEKLPEVTSGPKGKPRWSTPRRTGNWKEKWQCAKKWGPKSVVKHEDVKEMCEVVRCAISDEISRRCKTLGVGRPTVEKWMCLLAEYLELNGDEHVLLAILLSRYGKGKRGWIGDNDWCRPQRWECVVALAAYMAVLLSEEFPGKVAQDLQELLGSNFRFGKEQIAFLLAVEWRINVDEEEFEQVQKLVANAAMEIKGKAGASRLKGPHFSKFAEWFSGIQELNIPKKNPAQNVKVEVKTPMPSKIPAMSPVTPGVVPNDVILGKKRSRPTTSSHDLAVPGAKKRGVLMQSESPNEYQQVGVVPCGQDYGY